MYFIIIIFIYHYYIYCWFVAAGLDKIEFLQNHENLDIYQKVFDIIEHYFSSEEEDNRIAPKIDETSQQYEFNAGEEAPSGGFQFWRANIRREQLIIC